jgi:hypothetical protein
MSLVPRSEKRKIKRERERERNAADLCRSTAFGINALRR